MSVSFHETILGRRFFEGDFPRLIKAIERIADNLDVVASQQAQEDRAAKCATDASKASTFGVWHDLRKNPKDLPKEDGLYIVVVNGDIWGEPDTWEAIGCGFSDGAWDEEDATIVKWMPFPDIGEI